MEKYAELMNDIEFKLDEADKDADIIDTRYTHDEAFTGVRERINERK